ncbi:MerR family transcriptional regulator [Paenibacillus sp. Soil522]|uniref:MerR family transcriptional regulator n=1 Tax=Paenibacillus sp. Soil522 TaxID=1736388 RepID=UPI0006F4A80C|nr:MerR family transcriptional regulator [Paenibacillus sp. Soil522]KRE23284.1 MerR family transcriptional regulator [Paenibacillus sp. Soil522]
MNYSIGKFSNITGIGIHALRYYEKERLIIPNRKDNGRRCYSDNDMTWIQFIKRLKDTGMPIKEIQKYAELRAQGDSTMIERMEMLMAHKAALKNQIAQLKEHLDNLDNKIDFYKTEIVEKQQVELLNRNIKIKSAK